MVSLGQYALACASVANCPAPAGAPIAGARAGADDAGRAVVVTAGFKAAGGDADAGAGCAVVPPARHFST